MSGRYRTIVADPPWRLMRGSLAGSGTGWHFNNGAGGHPRSQPLAYPTLSLKQIAALPVVELAAPDAALYLWTVNAYVEEAYSIARGWGFRPSTLHTWCKAPMGGGLGGAFGITSEYFLYARRGSPPERRHTGTWHTWPRLFENGHPRHSNKPHHFYDLVEQVSEPPYVDLFARRQRLGWDVWGSDSANSAEWAGSDTGP